MTPSDLRATPDSIVVLIAAPWGLHATTLVAQTFQEIWVEPIAVTVEDGSGTFRVDGVTIDWIVEEPIPELAELCGSSYEPYAASEQIMLQQHSDIWRLVARGTTAASTAMLKVMSAFCEAGASGAFLPQTLRLHSPRTIQVLAVDPSSEQALANVFVNAWHTESWMRTRGLTAFGMPEIETPIADGLNGAYFRLMDIAANMLRQNGRFPSGSRIMAGPRVYTLEEGPRGPDDDTIPFAGHFGVQVLTP